MSLDNRLDRRLDRRLLFRLRQGFSRNRNKGPHRRGATKTSKRFWRVAILKYIRKK